MAILISMNTCLSNYDYLKCNEMKEMKRISDHVKWIIVINIRYEIKNE